MSRYTFRVRNRGQEGGLGVSAFYGEVGWDEELATTKTAATTESVLVRHVMAQSGRHVRTRPSKHDT